MQLPTLYKWFVEDCDALFLPVCQIDIGKTCPKGWTRHNDQCYEFFINPEYWRSWKDARNFCTEINAEMITITSQDDQTFLAAHHGRLAKGGVQDYWIGLSNVDDHSQARWVDGSYLDYNQFDSNQQLDTTQDQCVEALTSASEGNWQYQYCGKPRPFVCTVPTGSKVYIPDAAVQDYKCDPGWHYYDDLVKNLENCYYITNISQPYNSAQRKCEDQKAHLTSIHDVDEQEFVEHLLYKKSAGERFSGDAWIGLHTKEVNGEAIVDATWSDASEVTYTQWEPSTPKYGADWDGDCVAMYGLDHPRTGNWVNKGCIAADKRGICKKAAKYDPNVTPPPIIIHDDEEESIKFCGAVMWRYNSMHKKCVHYSTIKYKWDEHKDYCANLNGQIININSPDENKFVHKDLMKDPVRKQFHFKNDRDN